MVSKLRNALKWLLQSSASDPDDERRSRLLNAVLVSVSPFAVLVPLIVGGLRIEAGPIGLWALVWLLLTLLIYALNRRGQGVLGGTIFIAMMITVFAAGNPTTVATGQSHVFFVLPVMAASALIRPWASLPVAGAVSLVFFAFSMWAGTPNYIFGSAAVTVVAVMTWQTMKNLEFTLRQLRQAQANAQALAEKATAASQSKSTFLANMSHELRTPLNGILGYAQILARRPDLMQDEVANQGVGIIRTSGEHLLTLINDLLDLAKIEAGRLELLPGPVNLPTVLETVGGMIKARAETKGVRFAYTPGTLPLRVVADEKRLRQVLLNLLGNAVKFTPAGGSVNLRATTLGKANGTMTLHFEAADTGVGMTPEQTERLFRAFEQVGDRRMRSEGTGLGLALSQQLVGLMGGQIQVASESGKGSRFWFDVAFPPETAAAVELPVYRDPTGYTGPRRTLLVADDKPLNRLVLRRMLEPLGFAILEAEDGQQAVEQTDRHHPDVVLMDLVMPGGLNGFDAIKMIRSMPAIKDTVIIVVSASVFDQKHSMEIGCNAFLTKPIIMERLTVAMAEHLPDFGWLYAEVAISQPAPDQPGEGEGDLTPPPPAVLDQVRGLLLRGDLMGLADLGQQLERSPATNVFGKRLRSHAQAFTESKIEKLLKECVK